MPTSPPGPAEDPLVEAAELLRRAAEEVAEIAPAPDCYGDAPLAPLVAGFRDAWLPGMQREALLLERVAQWSTAPRLDEETP